MSRVIENQEAQGRYAIREGDDVIGVAQYQVAGDAVYFTHTEVVPEKRGTGAASELVRFALDDVRDNTRLRVVPQCSYVVTWIEHHEDYQGLLTR